MISRLYGIAVALLLFSPACAYDLTDAGSGSSGAGAITNNDGGGVTPGADSGECVPGRAVACDCEGGSLGVQTCDGQGSFGACDCTAPPSGGGLDLGLPDTPITWEPTCTSGTYWTRGDEGEEEMYPGRNCVTCHATGVGGPPTGGGDDDEEEEDEEGPRLTLGGTVYPALHDEDDCNGIRGAVVRIVGNDGRVHNFTTNSAGNFYLEAEDGSVAVPYTASVIYQGRELPMETPQIDLNCANCHTVAGTEGAPGRVVVP